MGATFGESFEHFWSLGRPWSHLGTSCAINLEKIRKSTEHEVQIEPRTSLGGPPGALLGPIGRPLGLLGAIRRPLWAHFEVSGSTFLWNLRKKLVFAILAPLSSETSTFEGPGGQVGATWAPKSRPKGVRTAKMALCRLSRGVRTEKVGLDRVSCLSVLLSELETTRKSRRIRGKNYL